MATNNAVNNLPQGRSNVYASVSLDPETVLTNITGDGTYYTLIFPNVFFNSLGSYNPSNGLFTCNLKGYYQVQMNLQCMYNANSVFSVEGLINIKSNGAIYIFGTGVGQYQVNTFTQQPFTLTAISPVMFMTPDAFDTIFFQVYADSTDSFDKTVSMTEFFVLGGVNYVTCNIEILRVGK